MPGFFSSLLSAAPAAANASAAYSEGQREGVDRNVAQALQAITLKRQQDAADLSAKLNTANVAHIGAQTELARKQAGAVDEKADFAGHIQDTRDGSFWVIHRDGSLSPATIRGSGSPPSAASPAPVTDDNAGGRTGDADAGAIAAGSPSSPPQATTPRPPTFGPKPTNPIIGSPGWLAAEQAKAKIASDAKNTMTPYQQSMLGIYRQKVADAEEKQKAAANKPTPDQVKASTVNDLAGPAADALITYHGGQSGALAGAKRTGASIASHIPLVGNAIEGAIDKDYQAAMNNARVLGTQYLEIMPKSRFQPSTIDDVMKQIAPSLGDSEPVKMAKIARIKVLKAAIAKRAGLRPDAPGHDLSDIPEPPGMEPPE